MNINREKPYFVGNWKMNKSFNDLEKFISNVHLADCHQWIAPQTIQLHSLREMTKNKEPLKVGSQNHCHEVSGAFTGETSIDQLKELNIDFTIVGHSERRQLFNETNETVNKKVKLSLSRSMPTILCLGETLQERESEMTFKVIEQQLKIGLQEISVQEYSHLLIAYEPVWAIGTGKTATPQQAAEVHAYIRGMLKELFGQKALETPILYGGSVKASNVEDLMSKEGIDGALIGGASLDHESFNSLCQKGQ